MENIKSPINQKNEIFKYTLGEDIANAVSHLVGFIFGVFALISLSFIAGKYGNFVDAFAFIFYGLTICFMFLMSTLYHAMLNVKAKIILKKMDHIAIYYVILGSYTPFVFSLIKTNEAYIIYGILVLMTIIGTFIKAFFAGKFKIISTIIYLIMGWLSLLLIPQMEVKDPMLVVFLLLGGISYTVGAIFYAFFKFKYAHMIWHIFVIFGILFMYIGIAFFILQYK